FIATCPAAPGLMVGSALDRGPDWAEGAITRGERLVAREVSGGVVVALVAGPAHGAGPVLAPADVLHVPAGVAGLGGWVPAVRYHEAGAVAAGFVSHLAAGLAEGGIGQAAPAGAGARQALLPQHPGRVQAFD